MIKASKNNYLEEQILTAEKKVIYEVLKTYLGKKPKPKHFSVTEKITDSISEMQGGYWLKYKGEILGLMKRTTVKGNLRILFTPLTEPKK